jgi:hypothetical protein
MLDTMKNLKLFTMNYLCAYAHEETHTGARMQVYTYIRIACTLETRLPTRRSVTVKYILRLQSV